MRVEFPGLCGGWYRGGAFSGFRFAAPGGYSSALFLAASRAWITGGWFGFTARERR